MAGLNKSIAPKDGKLKPEDAGKKDAETSKAP